MTENERLATIEALLSQNSKDIVELKSENKVIYDIATSVKVMATEMQGMSQQINGIKDDVSEVKKQVADVENKPAKEMLSVVSKVKVGVYSAIVTLLATGFIGAVVTFSVK